MRTQEQINAQIEGMKKEKETLPPVSRLGTPNHEIIDAKISILLAEQELDDIDEGDWDEMDAQNEVYRGAEEAQQWLDEEMDEDLFSL
jgi:hypothetical protein